ncbi:hypothetical protein AYO40_02425 [Planctomycetaceae bacterium SCGC AG-212-D15]|nr:hypothetical protein AYO40_02425 [Planctomycetaceae bacterium SCGC AG-212-D15]
MHRKNPMLRIVLGLILAGLVVASRSPAAPAVGAGPAGQLPAAQLIAQAEPAPGPKPVATPVTVPLGATRSLEMRGKKEIVKAVNENDTVANLQPNQVDNKSIQVVGRSVGKTKVTLTAADKSVEEFDVTVEIDVEYLRTLLQRVAPTSNITVTAIGGAGALIGVVITGDAGPSENINLIMRTAESLVGQNRVINAMRNDGVMQVQLDVVIALVSRTKARQMSFDLWDTGGHHSFASQTGGSITVPTAISGGAGSPLTLTNVLGNPNGAPPNFTLGLFNDSQQVFTFLQVLKNESVAKFLAEPHLVTISGRAASFVSGGEQAVPSPGGLGAVSVNFQPFGTILNFLPYVMNNGKIYLEVEPAVVSLTAAGGLSVGGVVVQGRQVERVHTSVEMEDGQTFVIGGLVQHRVDGTINKVPVLGDLPFIGAAFSAKSYREQEDELVVMVTPHVVDPMSCTQLPKVLPGQETRSVDDFELFLEGILEAPRGQREVCPNGHYVPAFKHSPTLATYPCGGNRDYGLACPGTGGSGLADSSTIGYPRLSMGGEHAAARTGVEESGAELGPPTDMPGEGLR